jgi:hypothetical protein
MLIPSSLSNLLPWVRASFVFCCRVLGFSRCVILFSFSSGRTVPGKTVEIVDEKGNVLAPGEDGNIGIF